MLLLRAVFGLAVLVEAGFYIREANSTSATLLMGLSAFVTGGLLMIGFLTPIIGAVIAAGAVGLGFSLVPVCAPTLFDSRTSLIFGLTMLLTIIGLGPGAYSLDARIFGRREIIIPPRSSKSE